MRIVRIKDIGQVVSGSTPKSNQKEYWDGDIPWVSPKEISDLESPYLNSTERKITEAGYRSSSTTLLPKNSILFTSRAPIGLVAINSIEVCTNQGFKSIILNETVYPLYIYYLLKANAKQLNSLGTGTTFKELSKSTFEDFEIPLPALHDQIKIATVLESVDGIIYQRKKSINLLKDLIRSLFVHAFGDPVTNNKKWPVKELGAFCDKITDGTHKTPKYQKEGIKFLSAKNIKNERLDWTDIKYIAEEEHTELKKRCNVEKGDILLSKSGSIGQAAIVDVDDDFSVFESLALIKYNRSEILGDFLLSYLNFPSSTHFYSRRTSGATIRHLHLVDIRSIPVFLPPKELQEKFSSDLKRLKKLGVQLEESLNQLEDMLGSLNQRAFKGELNLSNLNIEHIISKSKGGSDSYENLRAIPVAKNMKVSSLKDQKKPVKEVKKEETNWSRISINQLSDWIKTEFGKYHFTSEMLIKFLIDEKGVNVQKGQPLYYSSEEIKKNPKLDVEKDLKKIIYDSLMGESPFLSLEQIYYDGEKENIKLKIRENDYDFVYNKSEKERSGIYLKVKS